MKPGDNSNVLKWVLITSGVGIGLVVDFLVPGWGRATLLTVLIFGSLIGFGRPYWSSRFWIVAAATFSVHVGVVLRFRAEINYFPVAILFFFAVAEIVAIGIAVGLAFPDKGHRILARRRDPVK